MIYDFTMKNLSSGMSILLFLNFLLGATITTYVAVRAIRIFIVRAKFDKLYQHYFKSNHKLADVKSFNKKLYRAYLKQFSGEIQFYNAIVYQTEFFYELLKQEFSTNHETTKTEKSVVRNLVENVSFFSHDEEAIEVEVDPVLVLQI